MKRGRLLTIKKQLTEVKLLNTENERKLKSLNIVFYACLIGWLCTIVMLGVVLFTTTNKLQYHNPEPYFGWGYYDTESCDGRSTS